MADNVCFAMQQTMPAPSRSRQRLLCDTADFDSCVMQKTFSVVSHSRQRPMCHAVAQFYLATQQTVLPVRHGRHRLLSIAAQLDSMPRLDEQERPNSPLRPQTSLVYPLPDCVNHRCKNGRRGLSNTRRRMAPRMPSPASGMGAKNCASAAGLHGKKIEYPRGASKIGHRTL